MTSGAGHVPVDLLSDHYPGAEDRAADAFRPDIHAAIPASEQEKLRPVTHPVPRETARDFAPQASDRAEGAAS